jgi:anti-anti-sigma regulatory factor
MLGNVDAKVNAARRDGYHGLRIAGDLTWTDPTVIDLDALADYEARLNPLFADGYLLGVCQYDPRRFPERGWRQVAAAHSVGARSDGTVAVRLACRRTPTGLRLSGEADLTNHAALGALLETTAPLPECVIDATGVGFLDAHSVGALLQLAVARGNRPTTIVASPNLARLLGLLGAASVAGLIVVEDDASPAGQEGLL